MENIIKGRDLSVYRAVSISLGQAKNENNQGIKSKLVFVSAKDIESGIAKPVTITLFEEEIGTEAFEELMTCRKMDKDNKPVVDARGGYVVDLVLAKQRSNQRKEQDEDKMDMYNIDKILRIEGGMVMTYKFPDGMRYANGTDGKRTKDKAGNDVIKDKVDVFVQVAFIQGETIQYRNGYTLHARGERIMNTFFREKATSVPSIPATETPEPETEGPGF